MSVMTYTTPLFVTLSLLVAVVRQINHDSVGLCQPHLVSSQHEALVLGLSCGRASSFRFAPFLVQPNSLTSEQGPMELPQFLQLCNVAHLQCVLQDAGVEQLQDLRNYFDELKEMCPDGYRAEMAATLGCKKIELSRLVAGMKLISGKAETFDISLRSSHVLPSRAPRSTKSTRDTLESPEHRTHIRGNEDELECPSAPEVQSDSVLPQERPHPFMDVGPFAIPAPGATPAPMLPDVASVSEISELAFMNEPSDDLASLDAHMIESVASEHQNTGTASPEPSSDDMPAVGVIPCSKRASVEELKALATVPYVNVVRRRAKYRSKVWHDRYLVLRGDKIHRFKNEKDFVALDYDNSKTLRLKSNSFALRVASRAFTIQAADEEPAPMIVENKHDLFRWVNVINAHVYHIYTTANDVHSESFDVRHFPSSQFFALDPQSQHHMGIRALPVKDGPRTGGTISPGEVIEVVGMHPPHAGVSDSNVCFQLADDKGWVCQTLVNGAMLLHPATGRNIEDTQYYRVAQNLQEPLPVRFGPSLNSQHTSDFLSPGERFRASQRWIEAGVSRGLFLKIATSETHDGGWIQMFETFQAFDANRPSRPLVICENPSVGFSMTKPTPHKPNSRT